MEQSPDKELNPSVWRECTHGWAKKGKPRTHLQGSTNSRHARLLEPTELPPSHHPAHRSGGAGREELPQEANGVTMMDITSC